MCLSGNSAFNNRPDLSVVVTRSSERLSLISGCMNALLGQKDAVLEIIVLDQMGDPGLREILASAGVGERHQVVYRQVDTNSLSVSRNRGLELATCRYVAFTDPDCRPSRLWAHAILRSFQFENVAIAGGRILPKLEGKERWYHRAVVVRERYAYVDRGDCPCYVEKLLGSNIAVDKELLGEVASFDEKLGRAAGLLLGGEETDLCARALCSGFKIRYDPDAVVEHIIGTDRLSPVYLARGIFFQGITRACRGGLPQTANQRFNVFDYLVMPVFLVIYGAGFVYGRFLGRRKGFT